MSLTPQQKRDMVPGILDGTPDSSTGFSDVTVSYTDLLSEGPVEGLVHGPASVYLGGQQLMSTAVSPSKTNTNSSQILLSQCSKNATIQSISPSDIGVLNATSTPRTLTILGGKGSAEVTASQASYYSNGAFLPAMKLTSSTGFFTNDLVVERESGKETYYYFDRSDYPTNSYSIDIGSHHMDNATRVQYRALNDEQTPIAGLTHEAFYYIRSIANKRNGKIFLYPDTEAGKRSATFGGSGKIQAQNSGPTGELHAFVVSKPGRIVSEMAPARLIGNSLTNFEDVNGTLKRSTNSVAVFIPGDGSSAATALPPSGDYTVALDVTVEGTREKEISLFTGLSQGGLLLSHIVHQNSKNKFGGHYYGEVTGSHDAFNTYTIEWPAPDTTYCPVLNPNSDATPILSSLDLFIDSNKDSGYTVMGYFKPPTTGYYDFQIEAYNMTVWIGTGADIQLKCTKGNSKMTTHLTRSKGSRHHPMNVLTNRVDSTTLKMYSNRYYPIRICFGLHSHKDKGLASFKWRKQGDSYSADLSQYFYYPTAKDWVAQNQFSMTTFWPYAGGLYDFDLQEASENNLPEGAGDSAFIKALGKGNFKNSSVQFRVGNQYQTPITGLNSSDIMQSAITNIPQPTSPLEIHTDFVEQYADDTNNNINQGVSETIIQALDENGFNLSSAQLRAVDTITINFDYPSGLRQNKSKNGGIQNHVAFYEVSVALKEPGEADFGSPVILHENISHLAATNAARTFPLRLDIGKLKPYDDFKIIIKRKTVHTGVGYMSQSTSNLGSRNSDGNKVTAQGQIGLCTSFLKYKLSYPYTCYARTSFNTTEFQQTPKRFYHLRGIKVKIPTNYIPREASSSGVAKYTKNSSGVDTGSYQDWDGSLTTTLHYTNNPAWIFYDILTNKRFGLGTFVKPEDIDIYALYRIGRYCDTLVPDGRGGKEPRFTANVYLTKKTACYKFLKDFATIFRGMLYWHNGKLVPVIDQEKDPVYNFTQANVIDGVFNYEGTGSKTRINQVTVSWVNPKNNYQLEGLLVEDRNSVIQEGKIIHENSVAFGCTSEKQAERYGRWKLWTAKNQTEIVSFQAFLESSFLSPGDIISISDYAKKKKRFAGRITSDTSKTLSNTIIPLDANAYLNPDMTYKLFVSHGKPGAYLAQEDTRVYTNDSATTFIDYKQGSYIPAAWVFNGTSYVYGNLDTEEKASNAKPARLAQNSMNLQWSDSVISEERDIVLPGGHTASTALTSLTVSSAFSETPKRNAIWLLEERYSGALTSSSAKMYKILNISFDKSKIASIQAVEHYNEKFVDVEKDLSYQTAAVEDTNILADGILAASTIKEQIQVKSVESDGTPVKIPVDLENTPLPPISDLFFEVLGPEGKK